MDRGKDPTKEALRFIEEHAFFKPSAKLEMEAYLMKKEEERKTEKAAADSNKDCI